MNRTTSAALARARAWSGDQDRSYAMRLLALVLLAVLLVPAMMMLSAAPAFAEDDGKDYSLYQLASNASTYFGERNSPDEDGSSEDRMPGGWLTVTASPASAGSLLGYADPEFSVNNVVGWLFASISGSSQTIMYTSLKAQDSSAAYAGLVDYAHFGAVNSDLGLDTMSSGIGGEIISGIGGSLIWVMYALALAVSTAFWVIIQFLKLINPFSWFYSAVAGVEGSSSGFQQELADGMTAGQGGSSFLGSLQAWIAPWYQLLQEISWQALVPLFIGFLLIGLVLFKKMDRGAAIKKLIVRIIFIGLGLPLLGSMYSGVLDKFDDSLMGQHAGPTRVVLSTYVDFESWMMNDRLGIPGQADLTWSNGQASADSMMSVRRTALAINAQANSAFSGISIGTAIDDAESAWQSGTVGANDGAVDDVNAVFQTFGLLNKYIGSQEVSASDFESGIKNSITDLTVSRDLKEDWFVDERTYGDVDKFGTEGGISVTPDQHPVISVTQGLTSSNPGGGTTTFSTAGTNGGCGFAVTAAKDSGSPTACNLAPLAAYNYLNTSFGPDSMTMFSSNNATSGFTRETHMAVSQVGTGPAKFMYWHNAGTVLGSIALLGFWYAIGMLVGAIKRTISLVAAIPFATLGAMAGIAKVIIYVAALILEVVVTLFMYQFVSEFIISVPDILAGPVSSFMDPDGIFGNAALGGIIVVILTLFSSLVITGITFALLRVRKSVLQAMDEVFTKLVDKFLDTSTAPPASKGGLMPAMAAGVGAGVGMAAGQKLASGLGGSMGASGMKTPGSGGPGGKSQSTNAGGLNGGQQALQAGGQKLALGPGGGDGPDAPAGGIGPDGSGGGSGGGQGDALRELPGGSASEGPAGRDGGNGGDKPGDSGGPLELSGARPGSAHSAKDTAQQLNQQGGLSNFGFSAPGGAGSNPVAMEKGPDGIFRPVADSASGGSAGTSGTAGAGSRTGSGGSGRSDGAGVVGTSGARKNSTPTPASTQGTRFGVGTTPGSTPVAPAFGGAIVAPAGVGTPPVKSTRSGIGTPAAPRSTQGAPTGVPTTAGRPAQTGRPVRPVGSQGAAPVAPATPVTNRRPVGGAPAPQGGVPRQTTAAPQAGASRPVASAPQAGAQRPVASAPQVAAPRQAAPGRPAQSAPAVPQTRAPRGAGQAPVVAPTQASSGRPAPVQRPVATGRPQPVVPGATVPRTSPRPAVTGRQTPNVAPVTPPRVDRGVTPAAPAPAQTPTPSRRSRRQVEVPPNSAAKSQRNTRKGRRRDEKPKG